MNDREELIRSLDIVASVSDGVARGLPGVGGILSAVTAAAARFASDLVKQGLDPVQHIERIHAADESLARIEESWASALREKFSTSETEDTLTPEPPPG